MPEKEPKIEKNNHPEKKLSEKKVIKDAKFLLARKGESPQQELSQEEEAKLAEIQRYLAEEETAEEAIQEESGGVNQPGLVSEKHLKQPWYKKAWQGWIDLNRGIDAETDEIMGAFKYNNQRDTFWDKLTRKKALKKIKEMGFESFEDCHLLDISIASIEKKPYGELLSMFNKDLDRSHFDFYGLEQKERAEIEEIKGELIIEGPLFGQEPIKMEWKAYVYQTKDEVNAREYSVDLYWHQDVRRIASAAWMDLEVPDIVRMQGKKMGLDVIVPAHVPEYNQYYKPHRGGQDPADRIPINRETLLSKLYYIKTTRQVFDQLKKYIKQSCFTDQAINPEYVDTRFKVKTEISQEIEKEREVEIVEGLKNRQFDEKIFYYGKGAQKFLEIVKSQEYELSNVELGLIKEHIAELKPFLQGRTLHDLGAANALKAEPLLDAQLEDQEAVDYVPIDINPAMIMAAAANINNPKVNIDGKVMDFSKPMEGKLETKPKMLALLGSTLGNGDLDFQKDLLKNISNSMTSEDFLLVGVHLKTDLNKTLAMYENPPGKDFVMTTIKSLGFPEDKIKLEMQADEESRQIKIIVKINEELVVKRGKEEIAFNKGENLTIFVSQKYEIDELDKIASKAGLKLDQSFTDDKKQYQLAIFKK